MRWVAVALLGVVGAYMVLDGVRALAVGDYLTPATGEYAGRLGPWSQLVEAVGIPARSTAMKLGFIVVGSVHLAAMTVLAVRPETAARRRLVVVAACSGLWYLPFGTLLDAGVLTIVVVTRRP